jgi:hypothetical protein
MLPAKAKAESFSLVTEPAQLPASLLLYTKIRMSGRVNCFYYRKASTSDQWIPVRSMTLAEPIQAETPSLANAIGPCQESLTIAVELLLQTTVDHLW